VGSERSDSLSTSVAVVGGGPGGYACAFRAADLGLDVTLIDPEPHPGGVCLYRGCIPSKTYLHVAALLTEAEQAREWGVSFGQPSIDVGALRAWKDRVVGQLTGGLGKLCEAKGVSFVRGRATFRTGRRLHVDCVDPRSVEVEFEHAVVATGSRPTTVAELLPGSRRVMSSTAALELEDVPASLLVVGGGYIGLELGTVYAALGSRVTIVEMTGSLLPGVDADLVRVVARALERRVEAIRLNTRVSSLEERPDGLLATLTDGDGKAEEASFDKVLVAVGRQPNSSGLGLSETAVETDDRGFIRVDAQRRTAEPTIFAIGDVVGGTQLAHKATHEGLTAAEVIAGGAAEFAPAAIPAVVFTDPELAWCGLTETEARRDGRKVKVARFPWQASGRAATLGRTEGLTKLVIDEESERVLGVAMVGGGAGELIAEGALAIEMGAVADDLAATIHPHPTLSETVMEAAEVFHGRSVHLHRRR